MKGTLRDRVTAAVVSRISTARSPEVAPTPVEIAKDPTRKRLGGRKDLRIDLATSTTSGVNI